jgi:uncharacterized protein (DUF302 family)
MDRDGSSQISRERDETGHYASPVVIRSVNGDFDRVWDDLNTALSDRGLVVSGVSHVQKMLDRTGAALGRTKKIFDRAKVLEFCSAVVSRDMMEKDPHFIAFCPYQIAVYTIPGEKGKGYLSYRRLIWNSESGKAVRKEVEKLLDGIVGDVVEMEKE